MTWVEFVKDYLSFSRKDRIAILVLLALIALVFSLPSFLSKSTPAPVASAKWLDSLGKTEQKNIPTGDDSYTYQSEPAGRPIPSYSTGELFYFDPNTTSGKEWAKLGVKNKTIQTILNYLAKGGRFSQPSDLRKIYGLKEDEFRRLLPYLRIENSLKKPPYAVNNTPFPRQNGSHVYRQVIDINSADTTGFISLPGIGSKLAGRIITFREKLGGFYSVEQVAETYGLPDSTFQKIRPLLKVEYNSIRKLNINTASIDELKAHPYIKWILANPIVAYRNEHGPFSTIEDLKNIMAITNDVYGKIAPYLVTQ